MKKGDSAKYGQKGQEGGFRRDEDHAASSTNSTRRDKNYNGRTDHRGFVPFPQEVVLEAGK